MPKNILHHFPFNHRPYIFLLSAQAISNLGDFLYLIALYTVIGERWSLTPAVATVTLLCMVVPNIIFGFFAGNVSDKLIERKKVMVAADIVRCFIVFSVILTSELWQLFSLIILENVAASFFEPAKSGKLKEIVDNTSIQQAVSYSEMVNNAAKIVGPILGGILVSWIGSAWIFILDALSFILSALLLTGLPKQVSNDVRTSLRKTDKKDIAAVLRNFFSGLSLIRRSKHIFMGLLIVSAVMLVLQISDSQAIILLSRIPSYSANLFGLCLAGSGFGMLISSFILGCKKSGEKFITLLVSPILLGGGLILSGLLLHLPGVLIYLLYPVIFFICGFSFSMAVIPFNVLTQKNITVDHTGTVFGTINSVVNAAIITGIAIGGIMAQFLGVVPTFLTSGIALIVMSMVNIALKKLIFGGVGIAQSDKRTF
ncbi:MFS transporter [Sporolactobacillus sp. KGMB 08714]|uniref:MFS transporter n=1 Tax=Sporolactobacillus sp. KGMB 08714 TaxID=3064704 RepID=UPI002FBE5140